MFMTLMCGFPWTLLTVNVCLSIHSTDVYENLYELGPCVGATVGRVLGAKREKDKTRTWSFKNVLILAKPEG